jgi:hypothetical protein
MVARATAKIDKLLKELKRMETRVRGELKSLRAQIKAITEEERAKRRARR